MKETRTIVLENGSKQDIPSDIISYLKDNNMPWCLFDMRGKFWPENREKTIKYFMSLPVGQVFIAHHVFEDFQQLELLTELFHKLRDRKFKFIIDNACLAEYLLEFLDERNSSITPRELEKKLENARSDKSALAADKKIEEFKEQMNQKFLDVLQWHEIVWMHGDLQGDDVRLTSKEDLIKLNAKFDSI